MPLNHPKPIPSDLQAFYRDRPVLVTGANGFIGLNMVYRLQALGANLTILTRRAHPRVGDGFRGRIVRGDLHDHAVVASAIAGQSIVFDMAGVSGSVQSNKDPFTALAEECSPHLMLYDACAHANPSPCVIFCSSRLVYGKPRRLPVDEDHPLSPESIYAVHKLTIENYLRVFHQTRGLPFVVIRLTNPFGPHQSPDITSHGVINQFIRLAAEGGTIRIFGEGTQLRDYIYVEDAVECFLRLMMMRSCHGQIFNLGGPRPLSMIETVRTILSEAGQGSLEQIPWPKEYLNVETGDYRSDLSKIRRMLPEINFTPFEIGLRATLAYYRAIRSTPKSVA